VHVIEQELSTTKCHCHGQIICSKITRLIYIRHRAHLNIYFTADGSSLTGCELVGSEVPIEDIKKYTVEQQELPLLVSEVTARSVCALAWCACIFYSHDKSNVKFGRHNTCICATICTSFRLRHTMTSAVKRQTYARTQGATVQSPVAGTRAGRDGSQARLRIQGIRLIILLLLGCTDF
jgi:hypothetical protein